MALMRRARAREGARQRARGEEIFAQNASIRGTYRRPIDVDARAIETGAHLFSFLIFFFSASVSLSFFAAALGGMVKRVRGIVGGILGLRKK